MKNWKRLLAFLLVLVMVLAMMASCGVPDDDDDDDDYDDDDRHSFFDEDMETEPEGQGGMIAATTAPIVETIPDDSEEAQLQAEIDRLASRGQKLTLTIGLPMNVNVDDYDTNAYTLWLEEQTGYDLQFIPFQSGAMDYKAQLSSMLAMGDELPDILWNFNIGQGTYEEYGAAGYFVDLAPYYYNEAYSATFWERLNAIPDEEQREYVIRQLTAEDGGMYSFARIEYSLIDTMQYQVYINQTWLDNLGLDMPTDFESLKEVLIAFRDKDPNRNGKKDELPLIGSTNASSSNIVMWLINQFTYVDNTQYFNVDADGKLYLPHITQEYRNALIEINKLIKEGLTFNAIFSMSNKELKSLLNPPAGEDLTVGVWAGHPALVNEVDNAAIYNYVAMPYWGYCQRSAQAFNPATFVTCDCDYPLAAWKLLMVMCSEEGSYRMRFGEKGIDWVDADPGATSLLSVPASVKVINEAAFGAPGNCTWSSIQGTILIGDMENCQISADMGQWVNKRMENLSACYYNYVDGENNNRPEQREGVYPLPKLVVPVEVSEADYNQRGNSASLISDALKCFCSGIGTYNDPTSDAQWNTYIAELEGLGYQTWMEHRQRIMEIQFPDYVKNYVYEEVIP